MLLVIALHQPVSGLVFVLDGVLIGAGDGRYLAVAGVLTLVAYVPLALVVPRWAAALAALWWAFSVLHARSRSAPCCGGSAATPGWCSARPSAPSADQTTLGSVEVSRVGRPRPGDQVQEATTSRVTVAVTLGVDLAP